MRRVSADERRRRLGVRHRLASPGASLEDTAAALVGFHATDPVSVFLAARARDDGATVPAVEEALYERRSLLRILGMRRTMFVLPPVTAGVVAAACSRALTLTERRRLERLLLDDGRVSEPSAWLDEAGAAVVADLSARGEATARELGRRLPQFDLRVVMGAGSAWATEVGAISRILLLLALEGRIVRARPLGTWLSSQYRWAAAESWLSESHEPMAEEEARAELVSAWLRTYGPGSTEDIAWWTGFSGGAVAKALSQCGATPIDIDGGAGWILPDDLTETDAGDEPWVALLPALDSTTMGWRRRDWYLDPDFVPRLFDTNGNAGPTIWSSGRIVGGWGQRRDGSVGVAYLSRLEAATRTLVAREAEKLTEWFGGTVATPRFRTPLEREIAGT